MRVHDPDGYTVEFAVGWRGHRGVSLAHPLYRSQAIYACVWNFSYIVSAAACP